MRVLVTGATGFIGRALVTRLVSRGHVPILLIEDSGTAKLPLQIGENAISGIDFTFKGDLRNRKQIAKIVRAAKPDKVIHLAAVGVTDPFLDYHSALEHNLLGTLNLLHALFDDRDEDVAVNQIIVARTPGEADNMNVYAASKAAAWAFCSMYAQTKFWPITGAVIFQTYGPGQHSESVIPSAFKAALAGEDFRMTSGDQQRDWVFVDDVTDGLISALDMTLAPGESIDLGTGFATSLIEVVSRIYQIVGRGGSPLPGAIPDRPGEVKNQIANANRTKQLIGWRSSVSLEEGLRRVAASTLSLM